jgi:hypothetical protein
MTNLGLCMQLPLVEVDGKQCGVLNCFKRSREDYLLGIGIQCVREGDERYARFDTDVSKTCQARTSCATYH